MDVPLRMYIPGFLLNSGKCSAAFNMALDEALLDSVSRLEKPVLRFYGWTEPAATFGYFQKYEEVERATLLRPLVRRPPAGASCRMTRTGPTASSSRPATNGIRSRPRRATAASMNGFRPRSHN